MTKEEIAQYRQCSEDWRHYDDVIWQIPSVAITIASAILAVAYQYISELLPRTVILFFGGFILSSLTMSLIKHRVFQNQRTEFLFKTEKDWVKSKKVKRVIKRRTEEINNIRGYQKIKGYHWLLGVMIITTIFLFGLASCNLYLFLRTIKLPHFLSFQLLDF